MENRISILSTAFLDLHMAEKHASQRITLEACSFIETHNCIDKNIEERILALASENTNIVFTSTHAVIAVVTILSLHNIKPVWKIFCLDGATQLAVENYWNNEQVVVSANNALELANVIIANAADNLVFFCGNIRRPELPDKLQQQGKTLEEIIVYETRETRQQVDKYFDGILFFSPSGVKSFFSNNTINGGTVLFAIGNTTADAIWEFTDNEIVISDTHSKEAVWEKAVKYFETIKQAG